ncbi:hypothetical protein MNBD_GAMMA16-1188 [hydrothermal vent metagenome]|uniref:ADP-heptose--lipooligosaccharide heptosyltransferase II n=1 Tax=hydrothermal vent metagenome TaxID=652676 RepID=A0A3B0ZMN3_9ZZZZ
MLEAFNNILVIRRDNIGDLLCTTPLISALRAGYQEAHIAVLANSYNAAVLANNPDINRVYQYTKAKHSSRVKLHTWWHEWRLFRALRKARFDLVIHGNPTPHPRTGKLAKYLKVPQRIGVANSADEGFNIAISPQDVHGIHHVEQVYSLLKPLGIVDVPGSMTLNIERQHSHLSLKRPLIGIHISSRRPDNRWPVESFIELIENLQVKGAHCVLFWAYGEKNDPRYPGDNHLAQQLIDRFTEDIAPYPMETLEDLMSGLAQVDVIVTPDGGVLHIASALSKPVVALFGCTDSATWGPWQVPHRTLHGQGRATNISVDDVTKATLQLLPS